MLNFENLVVLMIMDGYDVNLVIYQIGAVGVAFVLFCDSSNIIGVLDIFVLYSFICASKSILFINVEKILKNPAKNISATLAYLFTCVRIAYVL